MKEIEQNVFKEIYFHPEFEKDFKKYKKKWRTLEEDLIMFINTALKIDNEGKELNKRLSKIETGSIMWLQKEKNIKEFHG